MGYAEGGHVHDVLGTRMLLLDGCSSPDLRGNKCCESDTVAGVWVGAPCAPGSASAAVMVLQSRAGCWEFTLCGRDGDSAGALA